MKKLSVFVSVVVRSEVNNQGKLLILISFQCVDVFSEVGKILEGNERIYIKIWYLIAVK